MNERIAQTEEQAAAVSVDPAGPLFSPSRYTKARHVGAGLLEKRSVPATAPRENEGRFFKSCARLGF
jgi:hypothetical protein